VTGKRLRLAALFVFVVLAAVLAASCGGDEDGGGEAGQETTEGAEPERGGTYRVDVETSFDFTDAFDPTGEYTAVGWSFYTLMIRKLMTYRHVVGAEGNEPVPDLAAEEPEVSDDGLTYTFTLKDGIRFGPPVSREITSQDIAYAFNRIANPDIGSFGYPNYYTVISGFQDVIDGKAKTVSGIETPDDKTIVFTLDKPAGDFLYRVAMPATGPVPEEVAKCFPKAGDYGRYAISSGPYMIEGSDQLDISTCKTMKPISGYNPEKFLLFERNPEYDEATDSPEVRENFPDRFEFRINTNADDCFNRAKEALIEDTLCGETGKQIREYTTNEDLKDNLKLNPDDSTFYLSMNLAVPPFDDIHVRKAVNFVINKSALIRAWGGPTIGDPATHIITPSLSPEDLEGYDPYPSENFEGDVEAAMEEMKQSKYDTDQDGLCDAPECKNVLNIMGNTARDKGMVPVIEDGMGKIGITMKTRQLDDPYSVIFNPKTKTPFTGTAGWGKDYPDAYTFFLYLFDGRSITPEFTYNEPLVGLTEDMAKKIGIDYPAGGVPSIDADIDNCIETADAQERTTCWGDLDKQLMEEIVPWVPYIWRNNSTIISDSVSKWEFDQATGNVAWVHVAVDQSKQQQG
jgi:peptide/nickel transport system substrate-binding protein